MTKVVRPCQVSPCEAFERVSASQGEPDGVDGAVSDGVTHPGNEGATLHQRPIFDVERTSRSQSHIERRCLLLPGFSLLILAGGESSRMGIPKHLLSFHGKPILEHILTRLEGMFEEVLVAGRTPGIFPACVTPVTDVMPLRSPLVGVLSGLLAAGNPRVFVMGCDMPFIEPELVGRICSQALNGADVTVPVVRGFYEPLCAVYVRSCIDPIRAYIGSGNAKATGFYGSVNVGVVHEETVRECDPLLNSFVNLNTPGEFRRYCRATPRRRG